MNRHFLILSICIVCFVSCQREASIDQQAKIAGQDYFKLKSIKSTDMEQNSPTVYIDSLAIKIDSVNNKFILVDYYDYPYLGDSSQEIFSYNSNNQLIRYDYLTPYNASWGAPDNFYLSSMEFVRDGNGQVSKVLSQYQNGLINSSVGVCNYSKRGDTTLISYVDSARKDPNLNYYAAEDNYQVAIVNNQIAWYRTGATATIRDTVLNEFAYNGTGDLIALTESYNNRAPVIFNYQRGAQPTTELQKFIARLAGDLIWFYRTKTFGFLSYYIGYDYYYTMGNAVQSINVNGNPWATYVNEFDSNGNVKKLEFDNSAANIIYIQEFTYWP